MTFQVSVISACLLYDLKLDEQNINNLPKVVVLFERREKKKEDLLKLIIDATSFILK